MTVPSAKLPLTSKIPLEARLKALKDLIPEAFTEDKIDFDKLKSALGDVVETSQERYGLTWAGKSEAIRAVQIPSKGTLEPMPEASVNFDESQNLIIEGDNLEVLKLLQKSYYGEVKMIYIDPPYNTGNEFIYPDNFREGLEDYLLYSGQRADDGTRLSTSEEAAGRKHSRWLNMMYPRLFLARNLLREDGVIFISIDDNEVKNLRALMDEVFGEENFLVMLARRVKTGGGSAAHHFAIEHDYVIGYGRNKDKTPKLFVPHGIEYAKRYAEEDKSGKYFWDTMERSYTQTKPYKITAPDGQLLEGKWFRSKERFLEDLEKGEVRFLQKGDGTWSVQFKQRMAEGQKVRSLLHENIYKSTHDEIEALDMGDTFSFPKPVSLLQLLTRATCKETDIVLDFFAGSGTTAQAVMELNEADGGNRRFILVQLPEQTDRLDYPTIADITRERVRRVIAKLDKADEGKLELSPRPDRGFKAFRLTSSNFRVWDADNAPRDAAGLEAQLELFTENVTGEAEQSVLFELVLKSGFPLTAKIERLEPAQPVYAVEDKALYICLANPITQETLAAVTEAKPERFICLDVAFEGKDELKTNTVLQMRNAGIAFHTA